MRRVFGATGGWVCISKRFRLVRTRSFCNNNKPTPTATATNNNNNGKLDGSVSSYDDAYRKLDNLDLMTAAKILFTTPPKKKKFGIDFHLVQLFFVCMPSLAVYLVAQYARYEMRRMEAELEQKKKAEEAAKAKEMELKATEEKEAKSDPELSEVRVRLDKLEEAVKEIVVESKKQMGSTITSRQEDGSEKKHPETTEPINTQNGSEASSGAKDHYSNQAANNITEGSGQGKASGLAPFTDASQQNQKGNQNAGPSQGAKK